MKGGKDSGTISWVSRYQRLVKMESGRKCEEAVNVEGAKVTGDS